MHTKIKQAFHLEVVALLPLAIGLNIVVGQLTVILKLPIFLDSIGTILIALLAGPLVGITAGVLSSLMNGILDPTFLPFTIVSLMIGGVSGLLARHHMFSATWKIILSSLLISITTSVTAAPIAAYVFGGVTNSGNTLITTLLLNTGQNLINSVFTSQLIADISDKLISVLISLGIIKALPKHFLSRFLLGSNYINTYEE